MCMQQCTCVCQSEKAKDESTRPEKKVDRQYSLKSVIP